MNTQEIAQNVDNISLTPAATADHNKLCDIWPTVKEGLVILASVIKNPIVKLTINGIIAAGDAIIGKICN